uniref:Pilus assembly protein PilO n=1 Tax=Escherichia coli TaxID=562 RepID=A0A3G4RTG4_ECOLX|nr:pilus assembly protein PilO [Escherichia coli]
MADEDINPVVLLADPKVNHRVWAACLKWSPVVKKQRVPSHQKHKTPCKIQTAYLSESDCRQQKFPWEDQPHYRHRNTGQAGAQSLFFPCSGFLLMGEKWIRRLPVQR